MVKGVKNVIIVLSGKGGVGKSTVATQVALQLKLKGHKVGILDVDICGPSVPYLLQLEGKDVHSATSGAWVPVYADAEERLAVMSIGFITPDRNSAVIWRGPKKTGTIDKAEQIRRYCSVFEKMADSKSMIKQFLNDVLWDDIDYLVIDTPPGTSDEHITLAECLRDHNSYGAVIVTTPQHVAVEDARRQVTFCKKTGLRLLGVIENMSGYICPSCSDCSYIFSSGGGTALAELSGVPLLGRLPIDPALCDVGNTGGSLINYAPNSQAVSALSEVVGELLLQIPTPSS